MLMAACAGGNGRVDKKVLGGGLTLERNGHHPIPRLRRREQGQPSENIAAAALIASRPAVIMPMAKVSGDTQARMHVSASQDSCTH